MLRNRLPEQQSEYPDPILGLDLRLSLEDLGAGYAMLTENCMWDGGVRKRYGHQTVTTVSQGAYRGLGLHRFYYDTSSKTRLANWNTGLFAVSDAGVVSTLTTSLSADRDTHWTTWSVTDQAYAANGADRLYTVDNTLTFSTLTGTNIPATPTMVKPFVDRLFAIQGSVVVVTDARVDNTWAPTTSTWSAYRPSGSSGNPTAIHVHSRTGLIDTPAAQLLIFQSGALSALEGSDFGSSVVAASPPTGWDATLRVLDPRIGTESPYSICTVPGLGTFWFTQDNNVAFLPFGDQTVRYVGDRLVALNRNDVYGVDAVNSASRSQVAMVYHNRYLKLFLPIGATYPTVQYWLDVRAMQNNPNRGFVWYGPMTGQSINRVAVEEQSGDSQELYGLEGNPMNGMAVYLMDVKNIYKDATWVTETAVSMTYRTPFHDFGMPSMDKMMPLVRVDGRGTFNHARLSVDDLHSYALVDGLDVTKTDGSAFSYYTYNGGFTYGSGTTYGSAAAAQVGHTFITNQTDTMPTGDRLAVKITHVQPSAMQINALYPQVQIRQRQPVS